MLELEPLKMTFSHCDTRGELGRTEPSSDKPIVISTPRTYKEEAIIP